MIVRGKAMERLVFAMIDMKIFQVRLIYTHPMLMSYFKNLAGFIQTQ